METIPSIIKRHIGPSKLLLSVFWCFFMKQSPEKYLHIGIVKKKKISSKKTIRLLHFQNRKERIYLLLKFTRSSSSKMFFKKIIWIVPQNAEERAPPQVLPCEFCEMFQISFFAKHLRATAPHGWKQITSFWDNNSGTVLS